MTALRKFVLLERQYLALFFFFLSFYFAELPEAHLIWLPQYICIHIFVLTLGWANICFSYFLFVLPNNEKKTFYREKDRQTNRSIDRQILLAVV